MALDKEEQMVKGFEEKVNIALKAVETVKDDSFRLSAFNKILENLLIADKEIVRSKKSGVQKHQKNSDLTEECNFDPAQFNGPENFMSLNWRDKILIILNWAVDNHVKHGLTTSEITEIFQKKYAQPYITSKKISKEIDRRLVETQYIRPLKEGSYNRWFISEQGKNLIKKLISAN